MDNDAAALSNEVAITGSTGRLGGAVADLLESAGVAQRLLVRDKSRARLRRRASVATFSYDDVEASVRALAGVKTLLMVSASESATRLASHTAFVDAAAAAGIEHIVYTSFAAPSRDAIFTLARDHFHTEQHILASGMRHTFLRDNFYIDVMEDFAGDEGVIRGPAGDGRAALVARADVARAAATVMRDPSAHVDKEYTVSGPESLSFAEVAATIADVRGRDVVYKNETVEEAYESRRRWEAEQWEYDAWVSTYTAMAAGVFDHVTNDVEAITGQAPMSLREYLTGSQPPS